MAAKRAASAKTGKSNGNGANLGFEAKLWLAADKLRNNMDAAEYKHVVLGLIFLKYISDAFEEQHAAARWPTRRRAPTRKTPTNTGRRTSSGCRRRPAGRVLKASAKQPTIGKIVDDAMVAIERDNPSAQGRSAQGLRPARRSTSSASAN